MTFYIPLFWCGVASTLFAEFAALIVLGVVMSKSNKRRRGDK